MQNLPQFLKDKGFEPNVDINPDLVNLGTETAFDFGAEVMRVERSGKFSQVYKFHIGDTGPTTPEPIIDVAVQALKDKQTKYAHFLGFPPVRENIAKYMSETRGVEIKKQNVMLQPGGKPVIEMAIQALLKPGDKVIAQNPGYPVYESLARFYAGENNYIPWLARRNSNKDTLEFKVEDLERILAENSGVKLLIINTPQNPTGMVLPREKLEAIAELVRKYKFMVLFDDIYDRIIFGGREHFSFLSIPGMLDYTVNLNGYSKSYAMAGWRVGFIVAPEWLIEIFGRLSINKWSCVSRVNQIVAGAIFGDVELDGFKYQSVREKIKPTLDADYKGYERKGMFLAECLKLLRPYVAPNGVGGAFYIFPCFSKVLNLSYVADQLAINTDKELSHWLLHENGIAVLPGSDFGEGGAGCMRFSYAEDRNVHVIPGVKHLMKIVIELVEKSGEEAPIKAEEVEARVGELCDKYFK